MEADQAKTSETMEKLESQAFKLQQDLDVLESSLKMQNDKHQILEERVTYTEEKCS